MEEDLRTKAAPPRTFTNPDNMVEMIRRGNGFRDLASKQAVEHAIGTQRLRGLRMAEKTLVERAGETFAVGIAMASDVAGGYSLHRSRHGREDIKGIHAWLS
jgi:hypothetical protein